MLLIDDAQHLPPQLIHALVDAQPDVPDIGLYLFADPAQTGSRGWQEEVAALVELPTTVTLDRNCRNTREIHEVVTRALDGHASATASDIDGPPVEFLVAETSAEAVRLARQTASRLIADGLRPNDIAIIYDDASWYRSLWPAEPLRVDDNTRWDSHEHERHRDDQEILSWEYDPDYGSVGFVGRRHTALELAPDGRQRVAIRCLHLESALGLEFEAVVLLLDNPAPWESSTSAMMGDDDSPWYGELSDDDGFDAGVWLTSLAGDTASQVRAYAGCTRSRTSLTLIGCEQILAVLRSDHPAQ